MAAVTVMKSFIHEKIALNSKEREVCGVATTVTVIEGDEETGKSVDYATRAFKACDVPSVTMVMAFS